MVLGARLRAVRTVLGVAVSMALFLSPGVFEAEPADPAPIEWGMRGMEAVGLKEAFDDLHLKFYGWIAQSVTFNLDSPKDRLNVFRVFDDRSNDYRFNQFSMIFERTLAEGTGFDVGFKVQAIYGSDSRFIHARDLPEADSFFRKETVQIDPTQFYGLVRIPVGSGLTVKMGKYVSPLGYEVIDAPGNPLYSHSYLFGFAVPATHTGIQLDYPITDFLGVCYGLVRGWDSITVDPNDTLSHMFGFALKPTKALTTLVNVITGPERPHENTDYRTVVDFIATYQWTESWSTSVNVDWGNERGVSDMGDNWWGVAAYATYKFSPFVASTLRAEYFRDNTGSRLGIAERLVEVTLGVDLHPFKDLYNLRFRPEVRWDHAVGEPFDRGTKHNQFTLGGDVIFTF
jgi:hypothetical protein